MLPYAITVKHIYATDTEGARFKASCQGLGTVTVPHDYRAGFEGNCDLAVLALLKKFGICSAKQVYLTRGCIADGTRVYSLHTFSNCLEVPKSY